MRALAVAGGVAVAAGVAWYLSRRPAAWYSVYLSRPPSGAAAHGHAHEHEHARGRVHEQEREHGHEQLKQQEHARSQEHAQGN